MAVRRLDGLSKADADAIYRHCRKADSAFLLLNGGDPQRPPQFLNFSGVLLQVAPATQSLPSAPSSRSRD
jgi:hypothetical protein